MSQGESFGAISLVVLVALDGLVVMLDVMITLVALDGTELAPINQRTLESTKTMKCIELRVRLRDELRVKLRLKLRVRLLIKCCLVFVRVEFITTLDSLEVEHQILLERPNIPE